MGEIVYVDLLFLINFSMDFLCFYITARLLNRHFGLIRCVAGAALGGAYSVIMIFFTMNVWLGLLSDLGVCALMCLVAFGCKDKSFYEFCLCTSSYFGVSACLGGFMTAIYSILNKLNIPFDQIGASDGISVWLFGLLAILSGLAAMMSGRFFKGATSSETVEVEIIYGGRRLSVRAFVDTGNMLTDPLSGRRVVIIDKSVARRILPEENIDIAVKGMVGMMKAEDMGKIRLIPMATAGGSAMLCAFDPEKIAIRVTGKKGKVREIETNALFAPADMALTMENKAKGCRGLVSPDLLV